MHKASGIQGCIHVACTVLDHINVFKNSNMIIFLRKSDFYNFIENKKTVSYQQLFVDNDTCFLQMTFVHLQLPQYLSLPSFFYNTREYIVLLVLLYMCVSQEISRNGPCLGQPVVSLLGVQYLAQFSLVKTSEFPGISYFYGHL